MGTNVFLFMFLLYSVCSFCCLFTFGMDTRVLVTENYATWPGGWVIKVLIVIIIAKLFCVIPANCNVMCGLLESAMRIEDKPTTQKAFRTVCFTACAVLGWFFRENLDMLEAMTGGVCTMATSVVLPILFYLCIYWKLLSKTSLSVTIIVFVFSIILTIWLFWMDLEKALSPEYAANETLK